MSGEVSDYMEEILWDVKVGYEIHQVKAVRHYVDEHNNLCLSGYINDERVSASGGLETVSTFSADQWAWIQKANTQQS